MISITFFNNIGCTGCDTWFSWNSIYKWITNKYTKKINLNLQFSVHYEMNNQVEDIILHDYQYVFVQLVSNFYYLTKKSYLNKYFDVFTPTGRCCLAMTYLCIKMCIERRPLLSNSTQNSSIMTERRKKHACV